jgi:hypothetical protein
MDQNKLNELLKRKVMEEKEKKMPSATVTSRRTRQKVLAADTSPKIVASGSRNKKPAVKVPAAVKKQTKNKPLRKKSK